LGGLSKFPFTTKHDLRANYPFGMFAVPREQVARIHASSGTTGKPTVVGYTLKDIDTWANLVARSIRAAGARAGDLVHVAYGYGLFTGGLGAHYGVERAGCTVIPMSGGQTEKQVQLITDFQPSIIMCTPSYMQVVIEEFERQGLDAKTSSLKLGIFGAEPWTEAMRTEIETNAGIDAVDIYGLSEVMGPGVASECIESKDGPVIWEDHFYPEIIDPETGELLPDGSEGELVFTSLSKEALPIIRYRTRDLTRLLPPTSRSMRRMGKIVGRSDDMLIIRGVNVFPTQIEEIVLQHPQLSGQYQLVVTRDGHLDAVQLRCELLPTATISTHEAQTWLTERIKTLVGITTQVSVEAPNSIERTLVGKARRVVDLRKN
jgi:phenylacetate-CoA ligase